MRSFVLATILLLVTVPTAASAQDRAILKVSKPIFAVNEQISVEYDKLQGSGWDWIVIVQPSNLAHARGEFSAINPEYAFRFDPNDNSLKDRRGIKTFPALPEGEYEARYVAWYYEGRAGANEVLGPVRFRVGKPASSPSTASNPPAVNPMPTNPSKDLTGLWKNPGGQAVYRVRQIGTTFVWGVDATALGSYANMFEGQISGNSIDGVWEDLPGSPTIGGGRMLLKIESDCRFTRTSSVNTYAADLWVKIGSLCDVTGLASKPVNQGSQPTPGATPAPDPSSGPVVVVSDPLGIFNKPTSQSATGATQPKGDNTAKPASTPASSQPPPTLLDIPDQRTTAGTPATTPTLISIPDDRPTSGSAPPTLVSIPDDPPTGQPPSNVGNSGTTNSGIDRRPPPPRNEQPKQNPPKSGGTDWTRIGQAIGDAIRAGSQTGQPQTGTPSQTGAGTVAPGTCRGGSYGLGTPTPQSWRLGTRGAGVRVPWSTPVGVYKAHIRVFSGGRDVTGSNALPENSNFCGLSWSIYMSAPGYYDIYLYDPNGTPVAGPARFVVTQ